MATDISTTSYLVEVEKVLTALTSLAEDVTFASILKIVNNQDGTWDIHGEPYATGKILTNPVVKVTTSDISLFLKNYSGINLPANQISDLIPYFKDSTTFLQVILT